MRIAQLTLYGYFNYGQTLQRFALQHTLKKFADFVEFLWAEENKFLPETGNTPSLQCVLHKERPNHWMMYIMRESVRQSKFKDFENLHIRTRFDLPYLENVAEEYDFFVVGSDQVWNPRWFKPELFLPFVPHEKKIAYAASIGHPEIPAQLKEFFRETISDFSKLSVREENAIRLINELTGRTATLLPDPVLLLTADEWLAVAQKPTWFKEKYRRGFVLTYYLRKLPPPEVKTLADELNLPVINLLDTENFDHFTVGPAEFIWLFANSSLTFTNSFHGAAFSILFKRPFINRELDGDSLGVSMSMRLTTLLKLFGLQDRQSFGEKIFTADEALTIDFARRDEILPLERAKAFNFLSEALGVEPHEKILEMTT